MSFILLGVDPGEVTGLCGLLVPDSLLASEVTVLGCERVYAPSQTKKLESPAELERRYREKLAARYLGYLQRMRLEFRAYAGAPVVALEEPIDARPSWQSQKGGRRESGETRFGQGVNYATALHAVPDHVTLASYPVRGRKGRPGWQGGRTARVIRLTMQAFLRRAGWVAPVSEHELMACGVALYHLDQMARQRPVERIA